MMKISSRVSLLCLLLACSSVVQQIGAFSVAPSSAAAGSATATATRLVSSRLFSSTQEEASSAHHKNGVVPRIRTVEKLDDFLEFLGQDDQICVVKFHANWCKSCQKFGVMFRRWGSSSVSEGTVRLAEVEFGTNVHLCRALGIKKLPYVHIYKGSHGLLSGFPCGPNKFPLLEQKVERLLQMSPEELELEKTLEEGSSLSDHILTELQNEHFEAALLGTNGGKSQNSSRTTGEQRLAP